MTTIRSAVLGAAGIALALSLAGVARAGQESFPRIEGEVPFELQNDYFYDADTPGDELNDTYTTIEPAVSFRFTPNLSIETGLVFEPVRDPAPGEGRFLEDEGLYVETLFLQYATDDFSLFAGKINPPFGVAWDVAPGIYGVDFAEDYELTERVGFGGSLTAGSEAMGSHTLTAATFFADTSFFSRSAFTTRGRNTKSAGGVSNTEDFSSVAVALDGDLPVSEDLYYHLSVESQQGGDGTPENELGFAAAVYGSFDLGGGYTLEPIVEYVELSDAEGLAQDRTYLTGGAALYIGSWNISASATARSTEPDVGADVDDELFQLTGGYEFENGFSLDAGYRFSEEGGSDTHALGLLLAYTYEFAID